MAVYKYKAMDVDATAMAGTVVADTARKARDLLRGRGLTITEIRPHRDGGGLMLGRRGKSSQREIVVLIRELATLLGASIALHVALDTLQRQYKHHLKAVVQDLADAVASGASLSDALSSHDSYFDPLSVSIVRVGENTGDLGSALLKLANFKEKAHKLRSRVATALMYPAVVGVVGLFVAVFLMTYVVPNLLETLIQSGKELPTVTLIVKSVSDVLRNYWWLLLIGFGTLLLIFMVLIRHERIALIKDACVLRIPVVGDLICKENTSRMAVMMAGLLGSGLQFTDALEITRDTLRNRVFAHALDDYGRAVKAGRDIASPLEKSGVFSPMVVQMLSVGQHSGQLEQMLECLAETYDQQVEMATARLTGLLEPLLLVILAIMVGFIAFATILPIMEMSNVL